MSKELERRSQGSGGRELRREARKEKSQYKAENPVSEAGRQ